MSTIKLWLPFEFPLYKAACYVTVGNFYATSRLAIDKTTAFSDISKDNYYIFFDETGEKLGEAKAILHRGVLKLRDEAAVDLEKAA